MSSNKKKVREFFRRVVFERDKYTCKICNTTRNEKDLDAHHITNRDDMDDGGYIKDNGITVCKNDCHMKVELFHITDGKEWNDGMHPNDLYKLIKSHLRI